MADCSQVANWDRTICDSTAIFARQLTSEWTREKTPYKLAEALETARSAPAQYTERIFLDSGFSAWLAYFLATTGHARHYKGQQAELETIAAFEQLSTEQRRTVATTLVNTAAHPTVVSAIEQLSNRYKRRRLNSTEQPSFFTPTSTTSTIMRSSSEIQSSPTQSSPTTNFQPFSNPALNGTTGPQYIASTSSTSILLPTETSNSMTATSKFPNQETVSDPSIKRIACVYPQYLCGAIRKTGGTAAVTMVFPSYFPGGKVACLMSLAIVANKVQHIAMELFGTHLETEDGFRYIIQENGGRLFPQEVVLQGAQDRAIAKLLGPETSYAIAVSPVRKEEVRQEIHATRCVTLQITSNCHEDAILSLNLGLEEGFQLKEKLYK